MGLMWSDMSNHIAQTRGSHRLMAKIQLVHFEPRPMAHFETLLGDEVMDEVTRRAQSLHALLAGRVVWNVNSAAAGGGFAEMLSSLLGYPRSLGVDVRWAVIEGTPDFFR